MSLRNLVMVGAVIGATLCASSAQAGWHHWRGCYGGWGGYGLWGGYSCYDPCYTPACLPAYDPCCYTSCYRPCRVRWVGPLRRLVYRLCSHHYNYYGCWGGGWMACCPTCYSDPCCCNSWHDAGYGYYDGFLMDGAPVESPSTPSAQPAEPTPAQPPELPPQPGVAPPGAPSGEAPTGTQAAVGPHDALLTVRVPADSLVFVNGARTRSKGSLRTYVSRGLTPGFQYAYQFRVVTQRQGQPHVETRTLHVQAGQTRQLAFGATPATNPETLLTVRVPAQATVFLAGHEMRGEGAMRTYRTRKLAAGERWQDYEVRVALERDGHTQTRAKSISLVAGQQRELTFDFELDKVAQAAP